MFRKKLELVYKNDRMLPTIEYAARTCWYSHDKRDLKDIELYLESLLKVGHESWMEHSCIIVKSAGFSEMDIMRNVLLTKQDNSSSVTMANVIEGNDCWYIGLNLRSIRSILKDGDKESPFYISLLQDIVKKDLPSCCFNDILPSADNYTNIYSKFDSYPVFNENDEFGVITGLSQLYKDISKLLLEYSDLSLAGIKKLIVVTFMVNMPRGINEQFLRHRMSSFSKESMRYVNVDRNFKCLVTKDLKNRTVKMPVGLIDPNKKLKIGDESYFDLTPYNLIAITKKFYDELIKQGSRKEDARSMLTLSMMGPCVTTKTITQLEHCFELRLAKATQMDHRRVMYYLYKYMMGIYGMDRILTDFSDIIYIADF
jgi:thymidylate synthase ThyX